MFAHNTRVAFIWLLIRQVVKFLDYTILSSILLSLLLLLLIN